MKNGKYCILGESTLGVLRIRAKCNRSNGPGGGDVHAIYVTARELQRTMLTVYLMQTQSVPSRFQATNLQREIYSLSLLRVIVCRRMEAVLF